MPVERPPLPERDTFEPSKVPTVEQRERPTVEAPVVCEIVCQTELMINEKESTEEFYKVCTAAGIEGFCMKKFIAIQP